MEFKLLDNPKQIREKFKARFVMTWEVFQTEYREWIAQLAKKNYIYDFSRYEKDFYWNRLIRDFPMISIREALAILREHKGNVWFMVDEPPCCVSKGTLLVKQEYLGCVAQADPAELADLIEEEWFESYRLFMEDRYNPNPVLPQDVYVFDESMTWCVVFTHETTDWESELDDPMKAAETRVCILCRP